MELITPQQLRPKRGINKILSQVDDSHTNNPQRRTHIIPLNINTIFIKLLQDTFKETEFLEINCLPTGLQEGLYKVFVDMYKGTSKNKRLPFDIYKKLIFLCQIFNF